MKLRFYQEKASELLGKINPSFSLPVCTQTINGLDKIMTAANVAEVIPHIDKIGGVKPGEFFLLGAGSQNPTSDDSDDEIIDPDEEEESELREMIYREDQRKEDEETARLDGDLPDDEMENEDHQ